MIQTISQTLEVDPSRGSDSSGTSPFKTLTAALRQVRGNTLIRLAGGTYTAAQGEQFPLVVPAGVMVTGDESAQGNGVRIEGGGKSPTSGQSTVALVLEGNAQLRGVTVSNPAGSGVWLAAGGSMLRANRFVNCAQSGVVISGRALPKLLDSHFEGIAGAAIALQQQSKGEIRNCMIRSCGVGIAVADEAAPLLVQNRCNQNRIGIQISQSARPVLRANQVLQNETVGLWIQTQAQPDLGQPGDVGGNVLRYNLQADLRNDGTQPLISVGNDLVPQGLIGKVQLTASQIPDTVAVPPMLLNQVPPPLSQPPTAPAEPSLPAKPSAPPTVSSFPDMQGHWAAAYVEALADRELVKGFENRTYRPNQPVTRAEFATLVVKAFPMVPASQREVRFSDVSTGFWAADAIASAQRRGFLSGYPDGTFRPSEPLSRVQAMVAVANGLDLPKAPASSLSLYRDRAQIPSYAVDGIAAATQHRLVVNHPDPLLLRPLEAINRAEVATLIYQGLVSQGQAPVIDSEQVVRPDASQSTFPDLQSHWAAAFVRPLVDQRLISGFEDGRFLPDAPMTRAQYAALLTNAFRPQPIKPAVAFGDVPANHWAAAAIQTAYQGGFLSGFPDYTFAPDNPLVRVQAWVSLVNGLGLLAGQPTNLALLNRFQDRQQIPTYAAEAVSKATQLGLIVNHPEVSRLHPNQVASRADIAAVVHQTLVFQRRLPAVESPYIVRV